MSRAYQQWLDSQDGAPETDTDPADDELAHYHDCTLFEFTRCAEELASLGHTAADLARLVERHLTPEAAPYPETGEGEAT